MLKARYLDEELNTLQNIAFKNACPQSLNHEKGEQ
jgi:hypothetical protein